MVSERRLVLLGMSESGKSFLGNCILGEDKFESRPSPKPVTRYCEKGVKHRFGKNLTLIDTPCFNSSELTDDEIGIEISKCVMMSAPGPHCFLLLIPIGRTAEGFVSIIEFISDIFGEEMFKRTIVVFTRADELRNYKMSIQNYINQDLNLSAVVQRCANYMTFDLKTNILPQVQYLIDKVDEIYLAHDESYYSKGQFRVPAQAIERNLSRKHQQESVKLRSAIRPMIEPLFTRMLRLEQQIKDMKNENIQLKQKKEQSDQLTMEVDKCKQEVVLLQQSLNKTHNDLTIANRRQTRAMSKLQDENQELRQELVKLGGFRVLPPRGSNRRHPYVYYPR